MGWGKDNGKERQGEIYRGGSSGDLSGVWERQLQGET